MLALGVKMLGICLSLSLVTERGIDIDVRSLQSLNPPTCIVETTQEEKLLHLKILKSRSPLYRGDLWENILVFGHVWSTDEKLTIGASICTCFLVIDTRATEFLLGHFNISHDGITEELMDAVAEVQAKILQGQKFKMLLFAGTLETQEVTFEKIKANAQLIKNIFKNIGVSEIVDLIPREINSVLDVLYFNLPKKTVVYDYRNINTINPRDERLSISI